MVFIVQTFESVASHEDKILENSAVQMPEIFVFLIQTFHSY